MRNKYLYSLFIGLSLIWIGSSCQDEEQLLPLDHDVEFIKPFPEGDNPWDKDLEEIAERFGVKCLYDNLTEEDILKMWTSTSGDMKGQGLPKDSIRLKKLYTRFFKEHIFPHLNPQCTKGVLPSYFYFGYTYVTRINATLPDGSTPEWYQAANYNYNGMGFWLFCWASDEFTGFFGAPNKVYMFTDKFEVEKTRELVLKNIFKRMVDEKTVAVPSEFYDGFDYTTQVKWGSENVGDKDYYKRRGFPEQHYRNLGVYSTYPSDLTMVSQTSPTLNFCDYIFMACRNTKEEVEEFYKDFPLIIQYYDFVVEYMRDMYGMDLTRIAEPVTENLDANL